MAYGFDGGSSWLREFRDKCQIARRLRALGIAAFTFLTVARSAAGSQGHRGPELSRLTWQWQDVQCGPMAIAERILELSPAVRYAALYRSQTLTSARRDTAHNQSAEESDKYEELFVNPILLALIKVRGAFDCGGAEFVVVRYGMFYQLVIALFDGHVSVCFELTEDPLSFVDAVRNLIRAEPAEGALAK